MQYCCRVTVRWYRRATLYTANPLVTDVNLVIVVVIIIIMFLYIFLFSTRQHRACRLKIVKLGGLSGMNYSLAQNLFGIKRVSERYPFPLCSAMNNRWNRYCVSKGSSVTSVIFLPRSVINSNAFELLLLLLILLLLAWQFILSK